MQKYIKNIILFSSILLFLVAFYLVIKKDLFYKKPELKPEPKKEIIQETIKEKIVNIQEPKITYETKQELKKEAVKTPKKSEIKKEIKKEERIGPLPKRKEADVFYDLGSGVGKVVVHSYFYKDIPLKDIEKKIEELYKNISGFNVEEKDRQVVTAKGGSPVYGEIKEPSWQKILDYLGVTEFKKTVGIELAPKRHENAIKIKNNMKSLGNIKSNKTIEFKQEDIATTKMDDATIVYMCSTCYPQTLMEKLTKKLSKLKDGLIVITLKQLPDYQEHNFELIKEFTLPMTWSETSQVNIYKLNKNKKIKKDNKK